MRSGVRLSGEQRDMIVEAKDSKVQATLNRGYGVFEDLYIKFQLCLETLGRRLVELITTIESTELMQYSDIRMQLCPRIRTSLN